MAERTEGYAFETRFIYALIAGLVASVILAVLEAPLAWFLPSLAANWLLRSALAFFTAWILFEAVHRAAGMVGWPFSILVGILTVLVLVSHHVIFALHGMPTTHGVVAGWTWFRPGVLLLLNGPPLVALLGCIWLRHDGGADLSTLLDILTLRCR